MRASLHAAVAVLRRESRPFASMIVKLAVYAACRFLLVLLTGYVGLFGPSGSLHLGVAALGLVVVGLRFWVLFVVPLLFAYRLGARIGW
jgi:hypothetical protein